MQPELESLEVEAVGGRDDDLTVEHASIRELRPDRREEVGEVATSGFSSRLWSWISSPSRKTRTRNPSHFGSKIHPAPGGMASTRLASIGNSGGGTGRRTHASYTMRRSLPAIPDLRPRGLRPGGQRVRYERVVERKASVTCGT